MKYQKFILLFLSLMSSDIWAKKIIEIVWGNSNGQVVWNITQPAVNTKLCQAIAEYAFDSLRPSLPLYGKDIDAKSGVYDKYPNDIPGSKTLRIYFNDSTNIEFKQNERDGSISLPIHSEKVRWFENIPDEFAKTEYCTSGRIVPSTGKIKCNGKYSGDIVDNGMCDTVSCTTRINNKCYCGDDGSDCNFQQGPATGHIACSGKTSGDLVGNGLCDVIMCTYKRDFTKEDGTTGTKCYCGDDGSDCNFQPGPSTGHIACSGKTSGDKVGNGMCDVIKCTYKRDFTKEDGTTGIKCYCGDDGSDCNFESITFSQPSDAGSTIPASGQPVLTPDIAERTTPSSTGTPNEEKTPPQSESPDKKTPPVNDSSNKGKTPPSTNEDINQGRTPAAQDGKNDPATSKDTQPTPAPAAPNTQPEPKQRVKASERASRQGQIPIVEPKCFITIGGKNLVAEKLTKNQCNDNNIAKTQFTKGNCVITLKNPKAKLSVIKTDKKNCPMIPKNGFKKGNKYLKWQ